MPSPEAMEDPTTDDTRYPTPFTLVFVAIAVSLTVLLTALDQTIITTAIPRITNEFGALEDVGWYGSAYMLPMCSFQLVFGKLYGLFNLKYCFIVAIGIFELGSLICGVSPTSQVFILGRALAGLGSSGVFSGSLLILGTSVPLRKRPIYISLLSAMWGIASVIGPLIGGIFTETIGWRWCFYINLPIGAIVAIMVLLAFTPPACEKVEDDWLKEFDFAGIAALLSGVVALLLALQWGGSKYRWKTPLIIALLVCASIFLILFAVIQFRRGEKATIPLRLLKQRSIACSCLAAFSVGSCYTLWAFYLPIWFQAVKGASARESGIMNLPLVMGVSIINVLGAIIISATRYFTPNMIIGAMFSVAGAVLLTRLGADTGSPIWIGYQAICGAGIGLQQPVIVAQAVLSHRDVPTGISCILFFQTLGGACLISVGQNLFTLKLIDRLTHTLPEMDPLFVLSAGATSLRSVATPGILPKIIEAYNYAVTGCFYVSVAVACVGLMGALGIEWSPVQDMR